MIRKEYIKIQKGAFKMPKMTSKFFEMDPKTGLVWLVMGFDFSLLLVNTRKTLSWTSFYFSRPPGVTFLM